ncbi:MAG: recombinase family protein [Beutenbergiaceae bacterium]
MRAAIYLRSAVPNRQGFERQRNRCESFAQDRGFDLSRVYTDCGVSRYGLRQLAIDVTARQFDAVIVADLSRFGRNFTDFTEATAALSKIGCTIYDASTGTRFDLNDPVDRFTLGAFRVITEREEPRIEHVTKARRALTR